MSFLLFRRRIRFQKNRAGDSIHVLLTAACSADWTLISRSIPSSIVCLWHRTASEPRRFDESGVAQIGGAPQEHDVEDRRGDVTAGGGDGDTDETEPRREQQDQDRSADG